ncbi:unnamed protein product [Owenia fusiformis]|uniref:Uncharacterized protein n=1 Tax=Owenia fusiformis TaxID=6347 RepID=A0A8J1Y9R3_OWEFU|nr:unnamed protein product [Owenia fusiformis]
MATGESVCLLKCENNSHEPITLPDKIPVVIGRTPEMKIVDIKCSRQQLELTANYETKTVEVKQLGSRSASINGEPITRGDSVSWKGNSILCIIGSQYPHSVIFKSTALNGTPKSSVKGSTIDSYFKPSTKRKQENSDDHNASWKKFKTDAPSSSTNGNNMKDISGSEDESDSDKQFEALKKAAEERRKAREVAQGRNNQVNKQDGSLDVEPNLPSTSNNPSTASEDKWDMVKPMTLMVYTAKGSTPRNKVASFDIDGTIIVTKSGARFAKNPDDWKLQFPEVKRKLQDLHNSGYKIVFFTNQMGIKKGSVKVPDFQRKVANIVKAIGVPVQVFVSISSGIYRKPSLGMWHHLVDECNNGVKVDISQSYYVGDAAGRPVKWAPGMKKDFSCSDRLFAVNAALKFYTPEEFFQGWSKAPFNMPEFNPGSVDSSGPLTTPAGAKIVSEGQEIIVLVGFPASGKTFFTETYLKPAGYLHVNRDQLGSWQKCVQACKKAVSQGQKVAVDNTSPDQESRQRYTSVAKEAGVPCRCFIFNTTLQQARHNEAFRKITNPAHQPINDMIMNSYKSKFTPPTLAEGFSEIVKVNFLPKFKNEKEERIYKQFLIA